MVELISTRFLHLSLQLWVELAQSYPKTHEPIESLGIRDPTVQLETPQPDMRTLDAQTTAAVVDTVCTNHCAHVSHIFAAVPQRMAARSTLVCIVQGRNSFVTLGNSEGVRRWWSDWSNFGNLCRLHIHTHISKEVASLIYDFPHGRVLVGPVRPHLICPNRAILVVEGTAQSYHTSLAWMPRHRWKSKIGCTTAMPRQSACTTMTATSCPSLQQAHRAPRSQ